MIRCLARFVLALSLAPSVAVAQYGPFNLATTMSIPHVAPPSSPILPTPRDASANWKMAGLQSIGGIPNRTTQCGSTVNPIGGGSDDTANIQTAINNCTAGQFVNLGSGTFTIAEGNTVNLNKGVTLRGQGPGVTIVQHPPGADATGNACNAPGPWGATVGSPCPGNHPSTVIVVGSGSPTSTAASALAVDGVAGASTIRVLSTAGFAVGGVFHIDELGNGQAMPDASFNSGTGTVWASQDYRVEWNVHSPAVNFWDSSCLDGGSCGSNNFSGTAGINGDECAYSFRCGGVNEELHLITAIGAGPCPGLNCTLTFDSPLMLSYRTANSAQAHFFPASSFTQQASVENLTVRYGDQGNIVFQGCVYCWGKRFESLNWLNAGAVAFFQVAFRDQIDTFWTHNAAWPVNGGGGYTINNTYGSSENYIVNGISMLANKTIVCRASCAGTVVAYNYMDDSYIGGTDSWAEIGLNCSHLVGSHHALFEGNRTNNIDGDFTHGNDIYCTFFRNYTTGYREAFRDALNNTLVDDINNLPGGNGPIRCFGSHPYTYWTSFIGNICGIPGHMSGWIYQGNSFGGSPPTVLKLGWNDSAVAGAGPDPSANTIYPAIPTGVTAAGCVFDSANPCTTVVSGNYDYFTSTTKWDSRGPSALPNSLYLSGAPSFFSGFTWPPIDPIAPTVNDVPAHARWAACQPTPTASCIFQ